MVYQTLLSEICLLVEKRNAAALAICFSVIDTLISKQPSEQSTMKKTKVLVSAEEAAQLLNLRFA